jgi:hypothetical protein
LRRRMVELLGIAPARKCIQPYFFSFLMTTKFHEVKLILGRSVYKGTNPVFSAFFLPVMN